MLFSIFEMNRRMYEGSGWRERRDDLCSCSSFTPLTSHCYPIVTHYHPLSSRRFDHLCSCSSFIPLTSPANLLIMSRGILRSTWVAWSKKCPQWKRRRRPNLSCSEWAMAHWRIGALAHWNHLALKLLLWGLKHFLQLSTFPLFNEIFNKIFNKIISFWGIWASTIFINFI